MNKKRVLVVSPFEDLHQERKIISESLQQSSDSLIVENCSVVNTIRFKKKSVFILICDQNINEIESLEVFKRARRKLNRIIILAKGSCADLYDIRQKASIVQWNNISDLGWSLVKYFESVFYSWKCDKVVRNTFLQFTIISLLLVPLYVLFPEFFMNYFNSYKLRISLLSICLLLLIYNILREGIIYRAENIRPESRARFFKPLIRDLILICAILFLSILVTDDIGTFLIFIAPMIISGLISVIIKGR